MHCSQPKRATDRSPTILSRLGFRRVVQTSAAALLCGLLSSALRADEVPPLAGAAELGDLSLEALVGLRVDEVYGASKYQQKVSQAPASVTIVDADTIKRYGYRTLAEVLRGVRGLYVTYDRGYSNLGTRGFARPGDLTTRVLLLLDGHRLNDNLYGSALLGPEAMLDIDLIERVEIIRGPSASIYGNSAFFGVINIITKMGIKLDGLQASVEAGSFETHGGRFSYGHQFASDLELAFAGSASETAGQKRLYYPEFDTPETNHGIAENADGERAKRLFGRLAYRDLTLSAAFSLRNKQVPTAASGTVFNHAIRETVDDTVYVDAMYQHALSPRSKLLARAYYDLYSYDAHYARDFAAPGEAPLVALGHDEGQGEAVGTEVQLTSKISDRLTTILGVEARQSLHLIQHTFIGEPIDFGFGSDHAESSLALYAQGELVLRPDFRINAGLRYDDYRGFGGTLNPRLGLLYSPTQTTTLKLLYGQAFRAPNAYEQYFEVPGFAASNETLVPETIRTYELVLEQALSRNVRLSASAYRYRVQNLVSQRQDAETGLVIFQNADSIDAMGLELELEGRFGHGTSADVSWAFQQADDGQSGQRLDNSPRHLVKLRLGFPVLGPRVQGGLECQYTSSLKTLAGNTPDGFTVVNLTLVAEKLLPHLEASASLYNLLDRDYAYPGSPGNVQDVIPQDGRSLRVKLTVRF